MSTDAFDTTAYYEVQMEAFDKRFGVGDHQVVEFGGKPFGDLHAARVLPGYDPDIKARILQDLSVELGDVTLAMSLHAQDVLQAPNGRRPAKRIRGDTGLFYDDEVLRIIDQAQDSFDLTISTLVLSALPDELSSRNTDYIMAYTERLRAHQITVKHIGHIAGYPFLDVSTIPRTLTQNDKIADTDHLVLLSPGGGSGKFGAAVTEIAHKLEAGHNPNFVKFETFPVFGLPMTHPLNTAFLAATADLPNQLVTTESGQTNYDKDVQNLDIMRMLLTHYPDLDSPLRHFAEPTDMGVNQIEAGITDMEAVNQACMAEIVRRLRRYQNENANGQETDLTVQLTADYLRQVDL